MPVDMISTGADRERNHRAAASVRTARSRAGRANDECRGELFAEDNPDLVPRRGLEPPQCCHRQDLNLVRLPIPPSGHAEAGKFNQKSAALSMKRQLVRTDCPHENHEENSQTDCKPQDNCAPRRARAMSRGRDPFLERERQRYETSVPSREFILDTLNEQGVPVSEDRLAAAAGHRAARDASASSAGWRRCSATARSCATGAMRSASSTKLDLITGKVQGHPDGFGFLVRDDDGPDLFLGPRRNAQGAARRPRGRARSRRRPRAAGPKAKIVEVLERANHQRRRAAAQRARRAVRRRREQAHQPGHCWCRRATRWTRSRDRSWSRRSSSSRQRMRSRSRAWSRCSATMPIPAWKSRSRCASTICRTCFRAKWRKRAAQFPREVTAQDIEGREDLRKLPLVTIDGETARDFDDAVYCEPQAARAFALCGRDRRRQPLRAAWRRARSRGAQARQLGVFPAARDSDAAGSAVERPVLAQSRRSTACAWCAT